MINKTTSFSGFTLIEVILFIIISGLLGTALFYALIVAGQSTPSVYQQMVAQQTARQCMEWMLEQRRLNGFDILSCPSSVVPAFCTVPANYTIAVQVNCTTLSGDTQYKTLNVTVSGAGGASLSTLIAEY